MLHGMRQTCKHSPWRLPQVRPGGKLAMFVFSDKNPPRLLAPRRISPARISQARPPGARACQYGFRV